MRLPVRRHSRSTAASRSHCAKICGCSGKAGVIYQTRAFVAAGIFTFFVLITMTMTDYINEIEKFITKVTGQEVFPRGVYYFDKIPTDVQALSVLLVNLGAVLIAVLFSVLPAFRAARLHPVRALRYE